MINRRDLLAVGAASLLPAVALPVPASRDLPGSPDPLPAFEAALRLGPVHSGAGNHRWAQIVGGDFTGDLLCGRARSGRMDWFVDPCSGAVEVAMTCSVARSDGVIIELRDRTAHASVMPLVPAQGMPTAPQLFAAGERPASLLLAGRLDAADFGQGLVRLRAMRAAISCG